MFAMAGLGFVDLMDEDAYTANAITRHINDVPSVIHGLIHLSVNGSLHFCPG